MQCVTGFIQHSLNLLYKRSARVCAGFCSIEVDIHPLSPSQLLVGHDRGHHGSTLQVREDITLYLSLSHELACGVTIL